MFRSFFETVRSSLFFVPTSRSTSRAVAVSRRSGQSLMEILVGVTVGALLIGTAASVILPALGINRRTVQVQVGAALAKQLLDNTRVWSEGDWHNIINLATGTANKYFFITESSPFVLATGTESIAVVSPASGLVGWWRFDEGTGTTAYDVSGNANNGTLAGATLPAWSAGTLGNALKFDGVNATINLSNSNSFTNMSSSFSISHWVNTTSSIGQMYTVSNAGSGNGYRFGLTGGLIAFLVGNGSYTETTCGSKTVNDGTWHMITGVYNLSGTNQFNCYIDGVLAGTVSLPSNYVGYSAAAPGIGKPPCCQPFTGYLDDVRIYSRALSESEIAQLYSAPVYTRYFYVSDAWRSGTVVATSGVTYDPSTKLITAVFGKSTGPTSTINMYLTRHGNVIYGQTDWSGGSGLNGTVTTSTNQFATSTNMDGASTSGALYIAIPGY